MRLLGAFLLLALGACAAVDIHGPKTVVAPAEGGRVTVSHGNRLRLPLATKANDGYEWRRVEPQIMRVVAEGPADAEGINLTPARSGQEKLRLEYRPISGGPAQRSVDYVVTVPEDSGFHRGLLSLVLP